MEFTKMSSSFRSITTTMILVLGLSACNLPASRPAANNAAAVLTAAAQTVEANLTQAAINNPPGQPVTATSDTQPALTTGAPVNGATPLATATQDCDDADFVADISIPDGTLLAKNEAFTKTWRLKNTGTCSWTPSYTIVFNSGDSMSGPTAQALTGTVNPGQTVDISINLKAPSSNGNYEGWWGLRNTAGVMFAQFYVDIKVGGGGDSPAKFAVTSVNLTVSGGCGNFQITAAITVNGPGEVTYKWKRSDNATDTNTHPPVVFSVAGTQSVSTNWSTTNPGAKWMDIYIDDPNHQQFGRANFSCP
jgi:hypothetical protein